MVNTFFEKGVLPQHSSFHQQHCREKPEFVDFCVLDHNSFTMYAPVSTCRAQEISVECFIPKTGTVLREKTCGDIEILSPTEGIHIAFFDAQLFTTYDCTVHQGFAKALMSVFFPGADRFDQCCLCMLIYIHKAVGADIVSSTDFASTTIHSKLSAYIDDFFLLL